MLNFDQPVKSKFNSIIKVIGVGGGGSNAVNHMYKLGISGVDFIVCNTDKQALEVSPIPHKIQLGATLTEGLGAGAVPEVGKNAALESINEIKEILSQNTKMVFITAGMGGGTGTGAAPVIAKVAKELGILTVGIVTIPFSFEGKKRKMQAENGINELKENVDTLIIISNDKLREIHGNLKLAEAFSKADDVLTVAAKSIAEVIDYTLHINLDFNDIRTVMSNSGVAVMGSALTSGENRAVNAVEQALSSPLLNDSDIRGARYVLLNVTSGTDELTMDELGEINDYIQEAAGQTAEIIQGVGTDPNLGEQIKVTVIATGFKNESKVGTLPASKPEIKRILLTEDDKVTEKTSVEFSDELKSVDEFKPKPLYEEPYLKTTNTELNSTQEIKPANEVVSQLNDKPEIAASENKTGEVKTEITFEITNEKEDSNIEKEIKVNHIVVHKLDENNEFTTEIKEEPLIHSNVKEYPSAIENSQNKIHHLDSPSLDENKNKESVKIDPTESYFLKTQERIQKLKEISFKLKSGKTLTDLETEPAYVRRGLNLSNTPHSSDNNISRYTLSENEDKKAEIKPNNPHLHDKAD